MAVIELIYDAKKAADVVKDVTIIDTKACRIVSFITCTNELLLSAFITCQTLQNMKASSAPTPRNINKMFALC